MELKVKYGLEVSTWTVRRWRHALGWVWKRSQLVATEDNPQRVERLAQIRFSVEQLPAHEVMVFADALNFHRLPKMGAAWMPKGSQEEVMTPGQNGKFYLAGALNLATIGPHASSTAPSWWRKQRGWCGKDQAGQGYEDHGHGRPPWSSSRHSRCKCFAA
jgi:hypothetical protein